MLALSDCDKDQEMCYIYAETHGGSWCHGKYSPLIGPAATYWALIGQWQGTQSCDWLYWLKATRNFSRSLGYIFIIISILPMITDNYK